MTVDQCAHDLGVSDDFIRGLIRSKKLLAYKVGKKEYRIKIEDWEKFLEASRTDREDEKND